MRWRDTTGSRFPRAHAAYSIGTLIGSLGAGALEGAGAPISGLFLVPVLLGSVVYGTARGALVPDSPQTASITASGTPSRRWFGLPLLPYALAVLLAIAFVSEIGDEAISDWYALYLREDLHSLPAVASMDYSVYALGILLGRIVGDPLTRHIPSTRVLQACGAVSGAGMLIGVARNSTAMMVLGTFVTGLGFSLILPTLYREAGSLTTIDRSTALSMMATAVYLGFMVGPLVIGPVSSATSLRLAHGMVGVLFFVVPVLGQLLVPPRVAAARLPAR